MITVIDDYYNKNESKQLNKPLITRFVDGQRANGFDQDFFVISNISQSYHMAIVKCEVFCVLISYLCLLEISYLKTLSLFHLPPALSSISPKMPNMFTNMIYVFLR